MALDFCFITHLKSKTQFTPLSIFSYPLLLNNFPGVSYPILTLDTPLTLAATAAACKPYVGFVALHQDKGGATLGAWWGSWPGYYTRLRTPFFLTFGCRVLTAEPSVCAHDMERSSRVVRCERKRWRVRVPHFGSAQQAAATH